MNSQIVKSICQMGTFMICAQAIVHFRPKASYEKYLKMLMSAMILMQLLMAVGGFFSKDGGKKIAERAEWFAKSMEESMEENMRVVNREYEEVNIMEMETEEKEPGQKITLMPIVVEIEPVQIGGG